MQAFNAALQVETNSLLKEIARKLDQKKFTLLKKCICFLEIRHSFCVLLKLYEHTSSIIYILVNYVQQIITQKQIYLVSCFICCH